MSNDKIDDLKAKFVAGAIPLESDYAKLLDMLEETRVAAGTSPDAPKSTSLRLTNDGYLDVAVAADGGMMVGTNGLSTDARVLWARNHAIATGASQFGMWKGGYAFIYILDGAGKRKLQFCLDKDQVLINSTNAFNLWNTVGTLVVNQFGDGTFEAVEGWKTQLGSVANTFLFDSTTTVYSKLEFFRTLISGDNYQSITVNLVKV